MVQQRLFCKVEKRFEIDSLLTDVPFMLGEVKPLEDEAAHNEMEF